MILTERQRDLLKVLSLEKNFVPTKFLASKFNVSLRTIRYDLENIEYFLKQNNIVLEKSPKKGIMIVQKNDLQNIIGIEQVNDSKVLLSNEKREFSVSIWFILAKDYITSDEIAEMLQVSKSTALLIIKQINKVMKEYNVEIKGRTNYGYKIQGREKDIRKYIVNEIIPFTIKKTLTHSVISEMNISGDDISIIIDDLEKLLNVKLSLDDRTVIALRILFFIKRNKQDNIVERDLERIKRYKATDVYNKIEGVYKKLIDKYDLKYHEEEIVHLTRILVECNALNSILDNEQFSSSEDENRLMNVIAEMVSYCYQHLKITESEVEVLVSDLMIHLKGTIKRAKLHIHSNNSILDQIKAKYGDVFIIASQMVRIFEKEYGFKLSQSEIGFITMYICKAMENSRTGLCKNILIVCNTGRGAAKLLVTRIKNNIPEVNVAGVVSMLDLQQEGQLDDVDLIISTIKLQKVDKKVIVVSPIITSYELSSIREYLYLKDNTVINSHEKIEMEESIETILDEYLEKGQSLEVMEDVMNIFKSYSSKPIYYSEKLNVSFYEYTAMILVEIGEMITAIYKNDISQADFKKILGVFVHITMAIPRWQSGDFVIEQNVKLYKEKYWEEYKILKNSLQSISKMYNIPIKETEVIPILRYLL